MKQWVLFHWDPQCSPRRNRQEHLGRGNQNSQFPAGPVIKCFFFISSNSKIRNKRQEIFCLTLTGSQIYQAFKEQDLITCESKVQIVVSLVNFVRPSKLVSFDLRGMWHFLQSSITKTTLYFTQWLKMIRCLLLVSIKRTNWVFLLRLHVRDILVNSPVTLKI